MTRVTAKEPRATHGCVIHAVVDVMHAEPALEAVTLNKKQQAVSIAMVGEGDPDFGRRVVQRLEDAKLACVPHCRLLQGDLDCANCRTACPDRKLPKIRVVHRPETTIICRTVGPNPPTLWRWKHVHLPKFGPREIELPDDEHDHASQWKNQLLLAGLCAALGLAGQFLAEQWLGLGFFFAAYLCGSWYAARDVVELLRKGKLDVHFLMLAVAFGSASIGAWGEGAMLLFLFSFSSGLEHYAMGRTQREIRSLFKEAPKTATVLDPQGREAEIPLGQLHPGMRLLVRPDSQFPVDAEIVKGQTAVDESNLTGEAVPVDKAMGDSVLAGTMNLWGVVEVTVLRRASESALQKVIRLIREAQRMKAPAQRFTDKFGTGYTYAILAVTVVMFFVWWLGFKLPPFKETEASYSAFYHAMTLLVVASPCALVLSIPSAVLAAIAWGARRGILFRGGAAVEKLAEVKVVALDKTGTLTTGELRVEKVESFPAGREKEVAQLAFSLERLSTHPIARAVTAFATHHRVPPVEVASFESSSGQGLKATANGIPVWLGRREWLSDKLSPTILSDLPAADGGSSEVWLATDGLVGRILLRDEIRPQAQCVMARLRRSGLKSVVLTGDRKSAGEILKSQLMVNEVKAELKPQEKVEAIRGFVKSGEPVAMIGDGVNDAPSLAAAHVGVAMGARGSDAALEQADVVLMHDRLENFWLAFRLSQRARSVIRQNLAISLGTVLVLVTFAMLGAIPLTVGVIGHEGSTVIVVFNSLRLLLSKEKSPCTAETETPENR